MTILEHPSICFLKGCEFCNVFKQIFLKGGFKLQKREPKGVTLQKNTMEKDTYNRIVSLYPSSDDATYVQYQLRLNDSHFRKVLGMN